jgi:hypothetical protein
MKLSMYTALIFLTSCLGYKELPVEYDYSYKGQFKRYRTFEMVTPDKSDDPMQSNETIEKAIISRMRFLGYSRSSRRPQLLVGYRIFTDSLRYRGYDQPELDQYLRVQNKELEYSPVKINMSTGTLAIYFMDVKQYRTVWQGYAVGLSRNMDYNSPRQLRNAVISILDQYRVWAEGFLERVEAAADDQ